MHIPDCFSSYTRYNDFKRKREEEPHLSVMGLHQHIEQLSIILMQPWLSAKKFDVIRGDVENLVDILHSYRKYLTSKCQKMKLHQQLEATPVAEEETLLVTFPVRKCTPSRYCDLEQKLMDLPLYQPLFLNGIAPVDRLERRRWLSEISLPFPIMLYKYAFGNSVGTLVYAWRIPENKPADSALGSKTFLQLCKEQAFYSSRAMRRDFLSCYNLVADIPKMMLRNIFHTLLQDSSAAEYQR